MAKDKKSQLTNIKLIKAFTILIVVFGHSMILYSNNWSIYEPAIPSSFFNILKKYIDIFQMPLFIFTSGYIYNFNRIDKKI